MNIEFFKNKSNQFAFIVFIISTLAIIGALISEYFFEKLPCTFCIAQRIVFVFIAITCLLYLIMNIVLKSVESFEIKKQEPSHLIKNIPALSLFSSTLALASFGLFLSLYQYFIAKHARDCGYTFAQKFINATDLSTLFPSLFTIKTMCIDAPATMLGISYELYAASLFTLFILMSAFYIFKTIKTLYRNELHITL